MTYFSDSPEDTKRIAAEFAATLHGGEFIALEGEVGAGKTTFVQGFAASLGVEEPVRSPTFTVMNHYRTGREDIREIVHLDFYRLPDASAVRALGLEEYLKRPDTVVVAEWPRAELDIPDRVTVRIRAVSPSEREIDISREE